MDVKGEGKKCKVVECAMRRCVSVRGRVYACEERRRGEYGKGSRLSAETREEKHKTRLESRKSPQVFAVRSFSSKKSGIFLLEIAIIRNVLFIFAFDKTQPSLYSCHPVASI